MEVELGTPKENLADMEGRRRELIDKLNGSYSSVEAAQLRGGIEFLDEQIQRMRAALHRDKRDYPII
jgi:hypothetical protein